MSAERHRRDDGKEPAPDHDGFPQIIGPHVGPHEDEEERFLRPYAVDAGVADPDAAGPRSREGAEQLDLLSLVVAARTPGRHEWLRPERETILMHAQRARTVVELAAEVRLPLGQVRAIAGEMLADGSLQRCGPTRPLGHSDILHAVLVGLHAL